MLSSPTALVFALSANIFIQTSCYGIEYNNMVPCFSDATCSHDLPGSRCVEFECVCTTINGCKPNKIRSVSNQIGMGCIINEDCFVEHSKCSASGSCECALGWIPSDDKKKCIQAAPTLLCTECTSPTLKDEAYYKSGALGEKCNNSKQCLVLNSHCADEVCRCKDEFITDENDCLLPTSTISILCYQDIQCIVALGKGSQCLKSACSCLEGFEYRQDVSKCIKMPESSSSANGASAMFLLFLILLSYYTC